jgi:hypothetical protein
MMRFIVGAAVVVAAVIIFELALMTWSLITVRESSIRLMERSIGMEAKP